MAAPRRDRDVSGPAATAALEILQAAQASGRLVVIDLRQDWGHEDPRIGEAEYARETDTRDYPEGL